MSRGRVYLVGAGPGDPGLITLRGRDCLARADVIIYDRLANPQLLSQARADAERIYVGKEASRQALSQEEINRLLVDRARQGQVVCRLKGGDPFVFGRGGEEAEALVAAGIPFEVVPGVTSAVAAPAYAGIPVTHRRFSSSLAIVTGHEDPTKEESAIRWERLATAVDTLVFLMGVRYLPEIVQQLLAHGRPPETPVALVRWGTHPGQETLVGTLANIVQKVAEAGFQSPAVTVVGEVVSLREKLRWFDTQPLFGQRVLVTRTRAQASALSELLRERGAEPVECPVIQIRPLDFQARLQELATAGFPVDWLIFTSANGVEIFFAGLHEIGRDARALGRVKLGALGPATGAALAERHLRVDYGPSKFIAEQFLEEFPEPVEGQHILIPRARAAREALPEGLKARGADVEVLPVYETVRDGAGAAAVQRQLAAGEIDWVTFTSSSSVEHFVALVGPVPSGVKVACIGPVTADTAREKGLRVDVVAEEYTIPGLVQAIERYLREEKEDGNADA